MSSSSTASHFPSTIIKHKWLQIVAIFCLVNCSGEPTQKDEFVRIYNDDPTFSQLSTDSLRQSLSKSESSPIERILIAITANSNPRKMAIEGDKATAKINEGQFWLWRMLLPRSGSAITIFYSASPDLIQVRYGRFLQARARVAGIHSGDGYARLQQLRKVDGSPDLVAVVQQVQSSLTETQVPFYKSLAYLFVSVFGDELVPLVAIPHFEAWNGMASIAALPIYNSLVKLTPNFVVFTIAFVGFIFLFFGALTPIFARFGIETEPGHYNATSGVGCLVYLACFIAIIIVVLPMFGLFVISSNFRAEDLIMSQAIGIERNFMPPTDLAWWWILLLVVVTWLAKYLPLMFAPGVDEFEVGKSVLKSIFVTPTAYFILPAWLVIFHSVSYVCVGLFTIIMLLRR